MVQLTKRKKTTTLAFQGVNIFYKVFWKGLEKMSEEKGNLKGLAISLILISLIMGVGVGIVYFVGQSIY